MGYSVEDFCRGELRPMILQVSARSPAPGGALSVACVAMDGQEIATVTLTPEEQEQGGVALHNQVSEALSASAASLRLVLPDGRQVRDVRDAAPLRDLLGAGAPRQT